MTKKSDQRRCSAFSLSVQRIRLWEDAHLPLSQSRIAFDLFMLIAHSAELEQPMTLKELFNSLRYSERGIRYVLDQFIAGGWCSVTGNESDRRFRLVVATDLMRERLREYEDFCACVYKDFFRNKR